MRTDDHAAPTFGDSGFYVEFRTDCGLSRERFDSLRDAQRFASLARRNGARNARAICRATGASA